MSEHPELHVGDHVSDREDDDATMLVVGRPPERADEYELAGDGPTVATVNDDYPSDDRVIEVVFPERTQLDIEDAKRYAYPRSRLERVTPVHDVEQADG